MELDARKLQILKAIIDEYVLSAAPVGSRSISRRSGMNLSSATIRNEMADLEEMGYLEQPHTSAGRVPSDKAYRLYVDSMMHRSQLSHDEIRLIRRYFNKRLDEMELVMQQTAQALSDVTQYTAMVLPPTLDLNRLRHIQLVPLTEGRALLVVVTDTGFARDAVIRVPDYMQADELEKLSRLLTAKLYDCRMDSIADRLLTEIGAELRERKGFLTQVMETIERQMAPNARSVELSGATKILHYPEYSDMNKARMFLAAVEGRDALYGMLKRTDRVEFSITIGSENELEPLQDCSVVTATYRIGDLPMGSFGVIGPTRMNYGKVVSVLEFMRRSLTEILSSYAEEEE